METTLTSEERAEHQTQAETILQQLGGRQFMVMTGANRFTHDKGALTFRLPGSGGFCRNGINCVRVALTPADLYRMEFDRVVKRKGRYEVDCVAIEEAIYEDMLQACFTEHTGLETKIR